MPGVMSYVILCVWLHNVVGASSFHSAGFIARVHLSTHPTSHDITYVCGVGPAPLPVGLLQEAEPRDAVLEYNVSMMKMEI